MHSLTPSPTAATVEDSATDIYIQKLKNVVDSYILYDDGRNRYRTYVQMVEALLDDVRKDFYVVEYLYAHPMFFQDHLTRP